MQMDIVRQDSIPRYWSLHFDDGYQDVYRNAYPLLKAMNVPFAVPLVTNSIASAEGDRVVGGTSGYLLWSEVKEMWDSGVVTFPSHTTDHKSVGTTASFYAECATVSGGAAATDIRLQLTNSKAAIEAVIGKGNCRCLRYPYGEVDQFGLNEVQLAGYEYAMMPTGGSPAAIATRYTINNARIPMAFHIGLDRFLVNRIIATPTNIDSVDDVSLALREAAQYCRWGVLVFHNVRATQAACDNANDISVDVLEDMIDLCRQHGVTFVSDAELIHHLRERATQPLNRKGVNLVQNSHLLYARADTTHPEYAYYPPIQWTAAQNAQILPGGTIPVAPYANDDTTLTLRQTDTNIGAIMVGKGSDYAAVKAYYTMPGKYRMRVQLLKGNATGDLYVSAQMGAPYPYNRYLYSYTYASSLSETEWTTFEYDLELPPPPANGYILLKVEPQAAYGANEVHYVADFQLIRL